MESLEIDPSDQKELRAVLEDAVDNAFDAINGSKKLAEKVGPALWTELHYTARLADKEGDRNIYLARLQFLCKYHPCETCRSHMKENLVTCPPSKFATCFSHSVAFHNVVNDMLGKERMSLAEASKIYDLDCDSCSFRADQKSVASHVPNTRVRTTNLPGGHLQPWSNTYGRHAW